MAQKAVQRSHKVFEQLHFIKEQVKIITVVCLFFYIRAEFLCIHQHRAVFLHDSRLFVGEIRLKQVNVLVRIKRKFQNMLFRNMFAHKHIIKNSFIRYDFPARLLPVIILISPFFSRAKNHSMYTFRVNFIAIPIKK